MNRIFISLVCFLMLLASCEQKETEKSINNPEQIKQQFSKMLDNYYAGTLALDPLAATSYGEEQFNAEFPNYLSKAYKDSSIAFYSKYKVMAEGFDNKFLSASDTMSRDVLLWECDMNLKALKFRAELFPIDQMWSRNFIMGRFARGTGAQPFKTVGDYENWLKRLDGYVVWIQTAEERMKEGTKIRFVLPSSLILKVVPQLKAMSQPIVEEHLFYMPVKRFPKSFSKEDKERLTEAYATLLQDKLIPAFTSLHNYVSTEYLSAGRNSSGIDAIPNGTKFYELAIKKYTTTELSAEEIHQIGLDEVSRILSEINQVKDDLKFEGDLMAFFDHVRNSKELMPFVTQEQVLQNFEEIHKRMQPQLMKLFKEAPKTKFVVKRTEEFREASAAAQYTRGSLKDDRPGIFYVPIPDARKYNVQRDEALFLHEAIPGHHYQVALTQENDSLPKFRKNLWYSAYGEGWALYTESLGKELGLYKDPYQYLGMLGSEMHRAIRLVVDTGLHSKGWTREQAIQYSIEHEPFPEHIITREIERYMANPGQALSYKIGQIKIIELRQKAEMELQENFDIREFHHMILNMGCVPLTLLEKNIDQWIIQEKKVLK